MPRATPIPNEEPDEEEEIDAHGISLEELSQTYARMLGKGDLPYGEASEAIAEPSPPIVEHDPIGDEASESDACPITPQSILEAILFVGHPSNEPLTPERIASLMRGVRPNEIEQLVADLNEAYRADQHAMEVVAVGGGYRMQLCSDLHRVRDRLYGRTKETKLNQAAVDCLSLIAYQPGITREELEKQWNRPAGSVLNMLVRRNLLDLERDPANKRASPRYYPTQRMLNLFGLASLDELPRVEDNEPT